MSSALTPQHASHSSVSASHKPWSGIYGSISPLLEASDSIVPVPAVASSGIGSGGIANPTLPSDPFNLQAAMFGFQEPNERTIFAAQRFCGTPTTGTPTRFLIDGQTLHDAFDGVIPGALIGTIYGLMYYVNSGQVVTAITSVRIDPEYRVQISPQQALHMASAIIALRQFASFATGVMHLTDLQGRDSNRQIVRTFMSIYPTSMYSLAGLLGHHIRPAPGADPTRTEAAVAEYSRAHTRSGSALERNTHLSTVISIAATVLRIVTQIEHLRLRSCYRTRSGLAALQSSIPTTRGSLIHDHATATTAGEQAEGAAAIEDHDALPTTSTSSHRLTGHIWNAVRASAMRISRFMAPQGDGEANSGSMEDAHAVHVESISSRTMGPRQTADSNSTFFAVDRAPALEDSDDSDGSSGGGGGSYPIGSRWADRVPNARSSASATFAASAPAAVDVLAVSTSEPAEPAMTTTANDVSKAQLQGGQSQQEEASHEEVEVDERADSKGEGTTGCSQTPDEASPSLACSIFPRPSDAAVGDVVLVSTTEPTMTTNANSVSKARSQVGQSQQEEAAQQEVEVAETIASDAEGTTGGSQPPATSSASSTPADQSKSAKDDLDGASQSLTFSPVHRPSDANLEIGALNQGTSGGSAFTEMIESIALLISSIQSASVRASFEERFKTLIEWLQEQHDQLEGSHLLATDLKTYDGNFSTSNTDPLNMTDDYTVKSSPDCSFTPLEGLSASGDIGFAPEVPIMLAGTTSAWH